MDIQLRFNENSVSILNGVDKICSGLLVDNLYLIEPHTTPCINSHESNHKRKEHSLVNLTHLWHLRLGHINLDRIRMLVTSRSPLQPAVGFPGTPAKNYRYD